MILSVDKIEKLCRGSNPLISPFDPIANRANPAKVELHLGRLCYCSDNPDEIIELIEGQSVVISPNTIFLFETQEKFNFPKDLSGKMSLKMGLVSKGLLMPNQTQIDPGYNNVIFGMLYNLSSEKIELKYKQSITTLEVFETYSSKNTYAGQMNHTSFPEFVSTRIHTSLGDLAKNLDISQKDIESSRNDLDRSRKWWSFFTAFITILLTIATVVMGFASFKGLTDDNASQIKDLEDRMEYLEEQLEESQKRIEELEKNKQNQSSGEAS